MLNRIFSNADFLKKALDGSALKQTAISNNIANVNTPGYKRITVEFEELLEKELMENRLKLKVTNNKHIGLNSKNSNFANINENENISFRRDGNSINIDMEIAEKAKNEIYYNAIANQISRQFETIRTVIEEGGR